MKRLIAKTGLLSQVVLVVLLVAFCTTLWAADDTVPDRAKPGAVESSVEQKAMPQESKLPEIVIEDEQGRRFKGAEGMTFMLEDIVFEGNRVLSDQDLRAVVAPYLGKTIEVNALMEIADKVTAYYKKQGYFLSRAYYPPQTIKKSVIMKVREGELGEIIIQGNKRYSREMIRNTLKIIRGEGAVRTADVERALLLLMDYPGLTVKATLKPGDKPGTSDLVLDVKEDYFLKFSADLNNFGSKYTAKDRLGVTFDLRNLTKHGDNLHARGMVGLGGTTDAGIYYGRLEYTRPIGYTGNKLGVFASTLDYKLGDALEDLEAGGASRSIGFWYSHPFVRSRVFSWWVDFGFEAKNVRQDIFNQTVNEDKVRVANLGTTLQKVDSLLDGGFTTLDLRMYQGFAQIFDGQLPDDPDFIRLASDITFTKFTANLTRLQRLPYGLLGIFTITGQYSPNRLPSSEELHIGGAGTVRGYSQGEYSGDRGYYGTLELRVPLLNKDNFMLQLAAFSDFGRAMINDPLPGEENLKDKTIISGGLGLRANFTRYLRFQLDWAKTIGAEAPLDSDADEKGVWYFQLVFTY